MTEAARQEATQLLDRAKGETVVEAKIEALEALLDLCVNKEPALLTTVFPSLLALQDTQSKPLEHWYTNKIEELCKNNNELIPRSVDLLLKQLDSSFWDVTLVAIRCLGQLANTTFVSATHSNLWNQMTDLKEKIFSLLNPDTNKAIVLQALKFVQIVILVQSAPNLTTENPTPAFSLSDVPKYHTLLTTKELSKEAVDMLARLKAKLSSLTLGITTVTGVNLVSFVGKHRECLLPNVMEALTNFFHETMANSTKFDPHTVYCVTKAIRFGLLGNIKRTPNKVEWNASLVEALEKLSVRHHAERYRGHHTEYEQDEVDPRQLLLRQMPRMKPITPQLQMEMQGLVESVIQSLNFPNELEPLQLEGSDEQALVSLLATAISPEHRQEQLKRKQRQQVSATPQDESDNQAQRASKRKAEEEVKIEVEGPTGTIVQAPAAKRPASEDFKDRIATRTAISLQAPALSPKFMEGLCYQAFLRVLNSEDSVMRGGGAPLRVLILSKMASSMPLTDDSIIAFLDYISKDFEKRTDLVIQWLHTEWINNDGERYASLLKRILDIARTRINDETQLSGLVLRIPHVTSSVFDFLQDYAKQVESVPVCIGTLKELAIHRPPCRKQVLDILLSFGTDKLESLRTPTIKILTDFLLPHTAFEEKIIEFAIQSLDSLEQLSVEEEKGKSEKMDVEPEGKSEGQKVAEIEEEIKRRLLLYYAICSKKHDLLQHLVAVYVKVSSTVKRIMLRQVGGVIRSIGMTSPNLLALLRDFPMESRTFVLKALHIVTETQHPTPEIVSIVKEIYDTKKGKEEKRDAKFLIPILPALSKQELTDYLPSLIDLSLNIVKTVIFRIINAATTTTVQQQATMSPSDLLIALHAIPKTADVSVRKVIQAIEICFEQKAVVRQEVLAKLVDVTPIPHLFLRTIIQTVGHCKQMVPFVMGILKRLINKQIWKDKSLWQGFLTCCKASLPHSVPVILLLPPPQFDEALTTVPQLVGPIVSFCSKNKSAVPAALRPSVSKLLEAHNQSATPGDEFQGVPEEVYRLETASPGTD